MKYEFPECMHVFAAALHMLNVNPENMVISLPNEEWWKLSCALESKYRGFLKFDGRGSRPVEFKYMGITFIPDSERSKRLANAA